MTWNRTGSYDPAVSIRDGLNKAAESVLKAKMNPNYTSRLAPIYRRPRWKRVLMAPGHFFRTARHIHGGGVPCTAADGYDSWHEHRESLYASTISVRAASSSETLARRVDSIYSALLIWLLSF